MKELLCVLRRKKALLFPEMENIGFYGLGWTFYMDTVFPPQNDPRQIIYPLSATTVCRFDLKKGFVRWTKEGYSVALPDTIETRYAYWYVSYIEPTKPFDVRSIGDDLIALLVHARDTGETWALEDYLTEAGVL